MVLCTGFERSKCENLTGATHRKLRGESYNNKVVHPLSMWSMFPVPVGTLKGVSLNSLKRLWPLRVPTGQGTPTEETWVPGTELQSK